MRIDKFMLLPVLAGAISFGCASPTDPSASGPGGGLSEYNRRPLVGVWEVTSYRQTYGAASATKRFAANVKYCFTDSRAYLELAPEAATDTRDGWAPYYVMNDMLVFKLPAGESMMGVRVLSPEEMTLTQNGLEMKLRKISSSVDANNLSTPVLPRKSLPVELPAPVTPPPVTPQASPSSRPVTT